MWVHLRRVHDLRRLLSEPLARSRAPLRTLTVCAMLGGVVGIATAAPGITYSTHVGGTNNESEIPVEVVTRRRKLGRQESYAALHDTAGQDLRRLYGEPEGRLARGPSVCGDFSRAGIAIAPHLMAAAFLGFPLDPATHPALIGWMARVPAVLPRAGDSLTNGSGAGATHCDADPRPGMIHCTAATRQGLARPASRRCEPRISSSSASAPCSRACRSGLHANADR